MRGSIGEIFFGKNLSTRESLFRVIVIVGQTLGIIALVESLLNTGINRLVLIQLAELMLMNIAAFTVFKLRKLNLGIFIEWIALTFIQFPYSFYASGGTEGGAAIWFVLGLFYVFVLFQGKALTVFVILSILVDALVYLTAYLQLLPVTPMLSRTEIYLDSLFGAIAVGCASGIIMRLQIMLYQQEKALVEKQNIELENSAKAQSTFFAGMSHEIRTPINSIIGLNELIRRKTENEEIAEYAENVQISGKILLDLVNDILDYAQLEQNRMTIVDLEYSSVEMFRGVIQMMWIRMQEKNLKFQIEIDPGMPQVLIGDERRVEQILINLLTNAVKYTGEGFVRLSAFSEPLDQDKVKITISVQDTGIGIRKENLERLYRAFDRMDGAQNQKIEGSGLGLAITRQLLDLMDGDIAVDSVYTKGTTFTVTLVQRTAGDKTIGNIDFSKFIRSDTARYIPVLEAPEARILIVDDNSMNAFVMKKLLAETKIRVEIAKSGQECLNRTLEKYYHIIFMDYMMPDQNGADILKEIRRQPNGLCKDVPVILLTASNASDAKRIAKEAMFDDYLEKPIKAGLLEQELLRFLPESVIEHRKDTVVEGDIETGAESFSRRKPICITSDTVSDLPGALLEYLDIKIVPLYIRTDRGRFADTREIDSDNLLQYLTDKNTYAKADSLSVEEYEQFYANRLTEAENVIHISMAAHAGRSYGIAVAAAAGFDHVHVIDSGQISCGQGLITVYAAQLVRDGLDMEEIIKKIHVFRTRIHSHFVMPNANVFYQNGYTSRVTARFFKVLRAHPSIGLYHSRVWITGAYFGELTGAWKYFITMNLRGKNTIDKRIVYITYTNLTPQQQEFIKKEILRQVPFEHVIMQKTSCSTACNGGVQTMGFAYLRKE
jgi:DegV family protein with EDD domain